MIYKLCKKNSDVTALLVADDEIKLYAFGQADDNVQPPYVTYQQISGIPSNNLDAPPCDDNITVQVDIYAQTQTECLSIQRAIRKAIHNDCTVTNINTNAKQTATKLYTASFDCEFWSDNKF